MSTYCFLFFFKWFVGIGIGLYYQMLEKKKHSIDKEYPDTMIISVMLTPLVKSPRIKIFKINSLSALWAFFVYIFYQKSVNFTLASLLVTSETSKSNY